MSNIMTFHDGRNALVDELNKKLAEIVEERHDKPNYYILVTAQVNNIDKDIIDQNYLIIKNRPVNPVVGTMLYHVDNTKDKPLKNIWVLPRDIIQPESTINKTGDYSDQIFSSGELPNR